jgi:chemotaxis signal transduction protein
VVPVFDLSDAAPEHFMDIQSFLIVTRHEERGVAILAQEVNRIVDIHDGDITKVTPQGMSGFSVAKLGDEMIRVVQPQELLEL